MTTNYLLSTLKKKKKKKACCESYELIFTWGKMKTTTRETASLIALQNFSGGKGCVEREYRQQRKSRKLKLIGIFIRKYVILVKGGRYGNQAHILAEGCCQLPGADVSVNDISAFLDIQRCMKLGS